MHYFEVAMAFSIPTYFSYRLIIRCSDGWKEILVLVPIAAFSVASLVAVVMYSLQTSFPGLGALDWWYDLSIFLVCAGAVNIGVSASLNRCMQFFWWLRHIRKTTSFTALAMEIS